MVDLNQKRLRVDASSRDLYVGDIKLEYSVDANDYRSSVKELVTTLIEHQIVRLCGD